MLRGGEGFRRRAELISAEHQKTSIFIKVLISAEHQKTSIFIKVY